MAAVAVALVSKLSEVLMTQLSWEKLFQWDIHSLSA